MSQTQDAPRHRPVRRRGIWAVLLALMPLAVAGTALAGGGFLPQTADASGAEQQPVALRDAPVGDGAPGWGPVSAPVKDEDADLDTWTQQIDIKVPPPEPAAGSGSGGSWSGGGGSSGGSGGGSGGSSTPSYTAFCSGGASATASPGSAQGMLSAVNTERSRLGLSGLSWSSSLASMASSWSQTMADDDHLSHGNTPSPGGQNVGMRGYMSEGAAVAGLHAALMASPGHCQNIMRPSFTRFGAATADAGEGKWYLTQNFQ